MKDTIPCPKGHESNQWADGEDYGFLYCTKCGWSLSMHYDDLPGYNVDENEGLMLEEHPDETKQPLIDEWNKRADPLAWKKVADEFPPVNRPIDGYSSDWVHGDFNPEGIAECYYHEADGCFYGAFWNGCHDTYDHKACEPTHWRRRVPPK